MLGTHFSLIQFEVWSVIGPFRHARHKEVEAALAAGFDPGYADSFGNTLFHVACQNGIKRIAKLAIIAIATRVILIIQTST